MVNHVGSKSCKNLEETSQDAKLAAWVARSFGVAAEDIIFIEDWTQVKIRAVFDSIRKQFKSFSQIE